MIGTAPSVTVGGGTLTSVGSRGSTEGLGLGEMEGWTEVVAVTEVEAGVTTGVLETVTCVVKKTEELKSKAGVIESAVEVLGELSRVLEMTTGVPEARTGVPTSPIWLPDMTTCVLESNTGVLESAVVRKYL